MFVRTIETDVNKYLQGNDHKIFFIWGPRRSGKSTLLQKIATQLSVPIFNFDYLSEQEKFIPRKEVLSSLATQHRVILIDEIQNYPESTISLKILHDEFKVKIIATGSSELRQKGNKDFDSLAGRFTEHFCLPLTIAEIADNTHMQPYDAQQFHHTLLQTLIHFGAYPESYVTNISSESEKINLLENILNTYVLKDIITIYDLKNEKLAKDILTKIALQLGSEVSTREIANSLQANVVTVANYIEIFIKNYILIALPSFKTNIRKAVSENRKLYFYDLGIRNALVKDFRPMELRPDKGGVFENFIISELEKRRKTLGIQQTMYFYREYGGKEIDIVLEDYHKRYTCVELKLSPKQKKARIFPLPHEFITLDSSNYFEKIHTILPQ